MNECIASVVVVIVVSSAAPAGSRPEYVHFNLQERTFCSSRIHHGQLNTAYREHSKEISARESFKHSQETVTVMFEVSREL